MRRLKILLQPTTFSNKTTMMQYLGFSTACSSLFSAWGRLVHVQHFSIQEVNLSTQADRSHSLPFIAVKTREGCEGRRQQGCLGMSSHQENRIERSSFPIAKLRTYFKYFQIAKLMPSCNVQHVAGKCTLVNHRVSAACAMITVLLAAMCFKNELTCLNRLTSAHRSSC